jgi:hypothetical protein
MFAPMRPKPNKPICMMFSSFNFGFPISDFETAIDDLLQLKNPKS